MNVGSTILSELDLFDSIIDEKLNEVRLAHHSRELLTQVELWNVTVTVRYHIKTKQVVCIYFLLPILF